DRHPAAGRRQVAGTSGAGRCAGPASVIARAPGAAAHALRWEGQVPPVERPPMTPMLIAASGGILLAALIYTIAVFLERRAGVLKPGHLALFWVGFVVDTTATTLMGMIAVGFEADIHGFLGFAAIFVMAAHSTWATVVL